MKKLKEKGITLVALVVTIIILLILVGVTFNLVAGQNGLFSRTQNATERYKVAQDNEVKSLTELEKQIKKYEEGTDNPTEPEKPIRGDLAIGNEVLYTPKTNTTKYTLKGAMSGYGEYNESIPYILKTPEDQTINQEKYIWKVMSIDEKSGEVKIMGVPTSEHTIITLRGALGYDNGVYLLDEICRTLYSNTDLGIEARSIDLKDIEEGMNETGISENTPSGITQSYTEKSYAGGKPANYYPKLYEFQKESGVDVTDKENLKSEGISENDAGGEKEGIPINKDDIEKNVSDQGYAQPTTQKLMVKDTYNYFGKSQEDRYYKDKNFYDLIFGTGKLYWIASRFSRCANNGSEYVGFGIRCVSGNILGDIHLFNSYGYSAIYSTNRLCPVVSLGENIKLVKNKDGTWSIEE